MKIILLMNSLGAGGAERSMVEFAKFLYQKNNVLVKFLCLERRTIGLEEEVETYGIETIYYNGKNSYLGKAKFLLNVLKSEKPDLIHSVLVTSNILLRLARVFYKKGKVVQSLVNTPYSLERKKDNNLAWQKFMLMKQIDKWSARLTKDTFYHAITKTVLEHYRPLYKIKNNYKIIYRGRDLNKHLNSEKHPEFTIINSGRQEFAKGQIDILRALVYLRNHYKVTDIKLEILGREGSSTAKLKTYITENELEDQVLLRGFVNNVEERLARSHVFIFPSYYEGLGGALIEAFAAKLPCICSDLPVLKEVVGNEEGALFCAPGDYKCIAKKMLKLYKDEILRNKLSNYSFARFQDKFQIGSINKEMLRLYKNLLKSNADSTG